MQVTVKYFASLRDKMGRDEQEVTLTMPSATVADLRQHLARALEFPDNTLVAVNMEYSDDTKVLKDGDEVAFFPPVTGG